MAAPLILYINTTGKVLVANFLTNNQPFSGITVTAGDLIPVQLHFLQANAASGIQGALPFSYIDPSGLTPVSLAIGTINAPPTAGTFTATFGANTTSALAYNVGATALAAALNALASIISAGGVVVTGGATGPWRVVFNTPGVIGSLITINAADLAPTSQGLVGRDITGASGVQEVQVITLVQNPAALQNIWTATYGTITVTELQAGGAGLNEIQRITIPTGTYAGAFSLAFGAKSTGALSYISTAAQIQTALQALSTIGANNVNVIQSSPTTWDVTFTGSLAGVTQALIVATGTGLMMPMYLAANLNLNVQGIFDLVANLALATSTLQVTAGTPGVGNTVLQMPVTVDGTLLPGTPTVPPSGPASIYGFKAIPTGSNVVSVAFPLTLPFIPSGIRASVMMPGAGGTILQGNVDKSSITASGFNFILSSVPSATGSILVWDTLQ